MAEHDYEQLQGSLVVIASELFRFQRVFEKAVSKLEIDERNKYKSQYAWFSKKVNKALEEADLKLLNLEGQLYVLQTIEPIIMKDDRVYKTGTVILGRIEK